MSKSVKDIEELIPLMTVERAADAKRQVRQEMDKPPAERETFNQAFSRFADGTGVTNEELELATTVSVKTIYRYRSRASDSIPNVETLVKFCVGMRFNRVQTDYLFGLAGCQIKLNDRYYDVYQYYFDYCSVRKELTVISLLEIIS